MLLMLISLLLTIQSHSYHRSKFINSANFLSGNIYNASNSISSYFQLKEQNTQLLEENKRLRNLLFNSDINDSLNEINTPIGKNYDIVIADVIKNSFVKPNNYLTINKGSNDSIVQDMGVITSKGIIGIVEFSSKNFSTVQSILNSKSSINAKLKKSNHFGSLKWDQKETNIVQLTEVPRLAPIKVGDTIVTGGMSVIFPEGIPIGIIKDFELDKTNYYDINVELFNDMSNLNNVYIIRSKYRKEVKELEDIIIDGQ